jgi:NADH pyrophosphatase NudC (nudix superfamily)
VPARFCAQCGTELIVAPAAGRDRPQCPACGFIAYRNPTPVAMAVVEKDGCLLLIRRGNAPLQGYWAPPAGYVEIDESVEAAAVREAREEAGVQVARPPPGKTRSRRPTLRRGSFRRTRGPKAAPRWTTGFMASWRP